jgi:hypothetical protein
MAENVVKVEGIVSAPGGAMAGFSVPGPNMGAAVQVATGTLVSGTTLSAVATGTGSTIDLGSARANVTIVMTTSAGVSAGAVALELSQDNTNFFRRTAVTTNTASTVFSDSAVGAWRYARGVVTTNITGGTVSATIMGS